MPVFQLYIKFSILKSCRKNEDVKDAFFTEASRGILCSMIIIQYLSFVKMKEGSIRRRGEQEEIMRRKKKKSIEEETIIALI